MKEVSTGKTDTLLTVWLKYLLWLKFYVKEQND